MILKKINYKSLNIIYGKKEVMLCNIDTGVLIKTSLLYFQTIKAIIENKQDIRCNKDLLYNNKLITNLKHLLDIMEKHKIIINEDENVKENRFIKNKMIILSLTNKCNLSCSHCISDAQNFEEDLPLNNLKKIIKQLSLLNISNLQFTGGEPFMRNDIVEILHFTRQCIKSKISISTNGTIFDEDTAKNMVKYIDSLSISIDGYNDFTCSKIRGKGTFQKVITNVEKFKKIGFNNISMSMVVTSYTEKSITKFKKMCDGLGVKPIIRMLCFSKRVYDNKLDNYTSVYLENCDLNCKQCKPGVNELYIDHNGYLYPCHMLNEQEFIIGNLLKNDLLQVYERFNLEGMHMKIQQRYLREGRNCYQCDLKCFCHKCYGSELLMLKNKEVFDKKCAMMNENRAKYII